MTRSTRTLVVVSGGLSEDSSTNRLAEALTKAVRSAASTRDVDVVERVSIRDLAQEIASASITGFATGALAAAYDALGRADAVIAVSPTYKASYTGLFKAFWDATPDGLMSGVPTVVGATGGSPRHSLVTDTSLRPLFAYMKARVVPTGVYVAAEDWGRASLDARLEEAADELVAAFGIDSSPVHEAARVAGDADGVSVPGRARTLEGTRSRARDPFVNVPTMSDMLRS